MLEMLIYSKENNKELERNIFAGMEIIGHNLLYKDEDLKQTLEKWNVVNENNKNAIVFLLLSPWYARNVKEVKSEIEKFSELLNYKYNEDYIRYAEKIYHLIHNDEEVEQDDYMNKIEAIEKEKELIKQSIKETEELFNSRMDYYFGWEDK